MGACCSTDDTKKPKDGDETNKNRHGNSGIEAFSPAAAGAHAQDSASYPSESGLAHPEAASDRGAPHNREATQTPEKSAPVHTGTATPNGRDDLFSQSQDDRMNIHPGLDKYADLTASAMDSDEGKSWHSMDSMSSADLHTLHSQSTQATKATGLSAQSKGKQHAFPPKSHVTLLDDEETEITNVESSAFASPIDDDTRSAVSGFSNAPHGYEFYHRDVPSTSSLARGVAPGATALEHRGSITSTGAGGGGGGGFTVTDVRYNTKSNFQHPNSARSGLPRTNEPFADDDSESFYSCFSMATTAAATAPQSGFPLRPAPTAANAFKPTVSPRFAQAPSEVGSSQFHSLPSTVAPSTVGPASGRAAPKPSSRRGPAGKSRAATPGSTGSARAVRKPSSSARSNPQPKRGQSTSLSAAASAREASARRLVSPPPPRGQHDRGDLDAPAPASRPTMRPDEAPLVASPPPDMDTGDLYDDVVSDAMSFHTAVSYGTTITHYGTPRATSYPAPAARTPAPASSSSSAASATPSASTSARISAAPTSSRAPPDVPATQSTRASSPAAASDTYPVESEFTYLTARSAGGDASVISASTVLPDPPGMNTSPSPRTQSRAPAPTWTSTPLAHAVPADPNLYEDADEDNEDVVSDLTFLTARSAGGATTLTEANNSPHKSSIVVLSGLTKPTSNTATPTQPRASAAPTALPPRPPTSEATAEKSPEMPAPVRSSVIKSRPVRPSAIRRQQLNAKKAAAQSASVPDAASDDEL